MSAEKEVIEWLKNSLLMNIRGIGPNVFLYDVEHITPDQLPAITITLDSSERTEASTATKNRKRITCSVSVHVINETAFWSIKMLCDIRERISQVLEAQTVPASVIDYTERGAGAFETRTEVEKPVISQAINYEFLCSEDDY